jgi:hypothetical protein
VGQDTHFELTLVHQIDNGTRQNVIGNWDVTAGL